MEIVGGGIIYIASNRGPQRAKARTTESVEELALLPTTTHRKEVIRNPQADTSACFYRATMGEADEGNFSPKQYQIGNTPRTSPS